VNASRKIIKRRLTSKWLPVLAIAVTIFVAACGGEKKPAIPASPTAVQRGNVVPPGGRAVPGAASGTAAPSGDVPTPSRGSGVVQILYAGPLGAVIKNRLAPAFAKTAGYAPQTEGQRGPDVFLGDEPAVDGNVTGWYLVWGRTSLVIAYSRQSRFGPMLEQARRNMTPWYQVLESPGFRLGRTDPQLDAKGYRTIWMMDLAERHYQQPGLRAAVLGPDENPEQIVPEEELAARLQSGRLDAAIFYVDEVAGSGLPHISLPDEVNQSNPDMAALYGVETFTNARGQTVRGEPIVYTATAPNGAANTSGGLAFLQYLGSGDGRALLQAAGVLPVGLLAGGEESKLPRQLLPYVTGAYHP
jgi:molybdate/tungstate transport system substrate-binding protein